MLLKKILRYIKKIRYSVKVKVHFRYYHKREKYRCRMKEILQQKFFKKETSIIFFVVKKEGKTFDILQKLTFKYAY